MNFNSEIQYFKRKRALENLEMKRTFFSSNSNRAFLIAKRGAQSKSQEKQYLPGN